ncbi:hypothetical protein WME89_38755 [Sorangium sp. So ce321]
MIVILSIGSGVLANRDGALNVRSRRHIGQGSFVTAMTKRDEGV